MKEEQIIKLLLDGGPHAAVAFEQWITFQYYESALSFVCVPLTFFMIALGITFGTRWFIKKVEDEC